MSVRYDQSNFSIGEIDPKTYAHTGYEGYYKAAKRLRNFIATPQGGFTRRFGTVYVDTCTATNYTQADLYVLEYDNNATYLILAEATTFKIYLENVLIATVTTTYQAEDIIDLRIAQVQNDLVVVHPSFKPRKLTRANDSANVITAINMSTGYFTLTNALTPGEILPIQFTTSGTLPTTSPQIYIGRTYFARVIDANHIRVYNTSADAALDIGYFTPSSLGAGTNNVIVQNTWAINDIAFTFYPAYDFGFAYSALTFTPSATSGAVTLTASGPIFTAAMVGGVYKGGGGIMRITVFTDTTHVDGFTVEDFNATTAIKGSLSFLGEPAWSNTRGWPRTVSFFQQRLIFGGNATIVNGVWCSVTNEANNFDDSEILDTNAISYYSASGIGSYIVGLTSTESLLVHYNTGSYAPPASSTTPITPLNFYLVRQNRDGVSSLPPVDIDNQVVYVDKSGNNVKNLVYDLLQSRYIVKNISIPSSNLVTDVVDLSGYTNPEFSDCSYIFTINSDGSMGIFQTLVEQEIKAWSLATTDTPDDSPHIRDKFRHVASGINRCWFMIERNGALLIEELSFDVFTDATKVYRNWASASLTGLSYLVNQTVQISADGFYLGPYTVPVSGTITLSQPYDNITVGAPILCEFVPLPLSIPSQSGSTFYKPKHIRGFYINYYQTYGAYMNGTLIPSTDMRNWVLGEPPIPVNGVYLGTPMGEWDPFDPYADMLTITQSDPYPIWIIGISYIVEL